MVYIYIMLRTQIYLREQEDQMLRKLSKSSGLTKSQLIRHAIELTYFSGKSQETALKALERSAGAWKRSESGKQFVERIRKGRLAQTLSRS